METLKEGRRRAARSISLNGFMKLLKTLINYAEFTEPQDFTGLRTDNQIFTKPKTKPITVYPFKKGIPKLSKSG